MVDARLVPRITVYGDYLAAIAGTCHNSYKDTQSQTAENIALRLKLKRAIRDLAAVVCVAQDAIINERNDLLTRVLTRVINQLAQYKRLQAAYDQQFIRADEAP